MWSQVIKLLRKAESEHAMQNTSTNTPTAGMFAALCDEMQRDLGEAATFGTVLSLVERHVDNLYNLDWGSDDDVAAFASRLAAASDGKLDSALI